MSSSQRRPPGSLAFLDDVFLVPVVVPLVVHAHRGSFAERSVGMWAIRSSGFQTRRDSIFPVPFSPARECAPEKESPIACISS